MDQKIVFNDNDRTKFVEYQGRITIYLYDNDQLIQFIPMSFQFILNNSYSHLLSEYGKIIHIVKWINQI